MPIAFRQFLLAAVPMLCSLLAGPLAVRAEPDAPDTEHMFGFSEGSDIGPRGASELELETIGRFGRIGPWSAITTNAELKHGLTDSFRIAAAAAFSVYDTPERSAAVVDRVSAEIRYRALDRLTAPVGLTVIATPFFGFVDPSTGAPADRWGAEFAVAIDRALVPERLYGTVNLGYGFERGRLPSSGALESGSAMTVNGAVAGRISPWLYLGGEVRYLLGFGGVSPDALAGQALYAGPVFYLPLSRGFSVSGAWDFQAWGQATGAGGSLDLLNFERSQAKLRLSIDL